MIRTTTLLFCALFLHGVEEAAASQRGRCVGGLCSFQDRLNFHAANKFCKDKSSQLLEHRPGDDMKALKSLLSAASGRYWLRNTGSTDPGNCPAVSVVRGQNVTVVSKPCTEALDGFLCQYGSDDMCSPVQESTGAQVVYIFSEDFEMMDSETLPPGTVAIKGEVGAKYPTSKHICFVTKWNPAPWFCEVLKGGCERDCDPDAKACACPAGSTIHPNNVSCVAIPCADCAQGCHPQGDSYVCKCRDGYRLAPDKKGCVDVDECKEEQDACTNEGEECVNVLGGYECRCMDGFDEDDGRCVNVSICSFCEHMRCPKINGVYQCACREGFRVSPADPTKCVINCTERDCPAVCNPDPEREKKDMQQCFCPDGYITDIRNQTATCTDINECEHQSMCDHECENLFGGYKCKCHEGYILQDSGKCKLVDKDYEEEYGSGTSTARATTARSQPASFPSYVKTGSMLGMTAFVAVFIMLLVCLVKYMLKRCSTFKLHSFKRPDIDIFYLQQVTTETYKRLSFDKPFKNDSQRLSTPQETQTIGT